MDRRNGVRILPDSLHLSEQPGDANAAVEGVTQPKPDPTIHRSIPNWHATHGIGERPMSAEWDGAMTISASIIDKAC